MAPHTTYSRWSSLSSRIALLIAGLLVLSALITTAYSASTAHSAAAASSQDSMITSHESTGVLVQQAYTDQLRFRYQALAERKSRLKDIATPLIAGLEKLHGEELSGALTTAQAKAAGIALVQSVIYGNNDYFFAYDPAGTAIAHPDKKFRGKNLFDLQDANGLYVVRELLKIGKSTAGDGFLSYSWVRLNANKASPKLAYVVKFKPWDWVVGTGVYIDDIDAAAAAQLEQTKKALSQSFAQTDAIGNTLLFVLDSAGKVIVAPADHKLNALQTTDWGRGVAAALVARAPKVDGTIAQAELPAAFAGASEKWNVAISSFKSLGWTLVSAVPRAKIDAPGNALALQQALLSLFVLVLGLLIGLLSSRHIVQPVETMTHAALALEANHFDPAHLDDAAARKDEMGVLARAFQRMGTEIVQRETSLREQVQKLSVMIDHNKAEEEASAITESDYFKELAQRAAAIRNNYSDERSAGDALDPAVPSGT